MTGIVQALGGLGLFLFGMVIMTSALRSLADEKLRRLLARTVDNPLKGAATGALSTAVLQSSSATTVAAVGFVGAGLLTFPESLGIIFGANIGTTFTGWVVALLGLKLNLGEALLPTILVGVLFQLTGRDRLKKIGMAIGGFGLIFVGIGVLQEGMSEFQDWVTPAQFPPDTLTGRLLLVLIGIVITIVTQSSSAGVAAALVAVHTNTISLNQAAAMVIGMDVGTTATAAFATIGGNVQARRTGFAHVIYNSLTGLCAFALLSPYMNSVERILPGIKLNDPEMVLVGFHTFFNVIGVIAILPFTHQFAETIIRLFPERGNPLTKQLSRSLLDHPTIAIAAAKNSMREMAVILLDELHRQLGARKTQPSVDQRSDVTEAIEQLNSYLDEIAARFPSAQQVSDYLECVHLLDHLRRIHLRLRNEKRLRKCRADTEISAMSDQLMASIELVSGTIGSISSEIVERVQLLNRDSKIAMKEYRKQVVQRASNGTLSTKEAIRLMDAARSLRRLSYHLWRMTSHLSELEAEEKSKEQEQTQASNTSEFSD